jgi:hypothetical protein
LRLITEPSGALNSDERHRLLDFEGHATAPVTRGTESQSVLPVVGMNPVRFERTGTGWAHFRMG